MWSLEDNRSLSAFCVLVIPVEAVGGLLLLKILTEVFQDTTPVPDLGREAGDLDMLLEMAPVCIVICL